MTRQEQLKINVICDKVWENSMEEFTNTFKEHSCRWKRLDYCQAEVCSTENYYFLKSYRTIVAVIDKNTDTLIDMLRSVYGYTPTSAKHISKFGHRYGSGKWDVTNRYTYR